MLLVDRYEVQDKLGQGGMGVVYRAQDRLTNQTIALKLVSLDFDALETVSSLSDGKRGLFMALTSEFQILASLRHPNIISVLNYGFDEASQELMDLSLERGARDNVTVAVIQFEITTGFGAREGDTTVINPASLNRHLGASVEASLSLRQDLSLNSL